MRGLCRKHYQNVRGDILRGDPPRYEMSAVQAQQTEIVPAFSKDPVLAARVTDMRLRLTLSESLVGQAIRLIDEGLVHTARDRLVEALTHLEEP